LSNLSTAVGDDAPADADEFAAAEGLDSFREDGDALPFSIRRAMTAPLGAPEVAPLPQQQARVRPVSVSVPVPAPSYVVSSKELMLQEMQIQWNVSLGAPPPALLGGGEEEEEQVEEEASVSSRRAMQLYRDRHRTL
jgi:hypothetical protein